MAVILGLGGNLHFGDMSPESTILGALECIATNELVVKATSALYQTTAMPYKDQPDFVNAAAVIETDLTADSLLKLCHDVEAQFGRQRTDRWQARTLDIDLLVYNDLILPSLDGWWDIVNDNDPAAYIASAMVPHPRLHTRAFALRPLLDVYPDYEHPVLKRSGKALLSALSDQGVTLLEKVT